MALPAARRPASALDFVHSHSASHVRLDWPIPSVHHAVPQPRRLLLARLAFGVVVNRR
jgi:hypothetical protein